MCELFFKGVKDGIPIALGYFSVSIALGIMAVAAGCTVAEAVIISAANVTSAGEFAGIGIIAAGGSLLEMALTQFVINLRYSLMAISLSQKIDERFKGIWRALLGFFITDEIFAVAIGCKGTVKRSYFAGLAFLPVIGWCAGTLFGAVLGNVMPGFIINIMGIALYGMFVAIVVPKAREDRKILTVVALAAAFSMICYYVPVFSGISSGFAIIICSVLASAVCAAFFGRGGNTDEA